MMKKVVVIGASGRTGRPLVHALGRRGIAVRAITRHPDRMGLFADNVEANFADLRQVESLVSAFRGANAIHYIPPSLDPNDHDYVGHIHAACIRTGITRLVYHSVLHPHTPDLVHHMRKAGSEARLRDTSLAWTIIQPAMYAQTSLAFFDVSAGELMPPFDPTRPFSPIHVRDLAEAAAIIHTSEGHAFATYELAGPETLDFNTMGRQLSDLLGRSITTQESQPESTAAKFAVARGYNADQVRELLLTFNHYNRHGMVGNSTQLAMILGKRPTDFAQAMRESL